MRRSTALLAVSGLGMMPSVAMAEGNMPQMDFANPLTSAQVVWMAIIMIVLYFLMSRWALPRLGSVMEARRDRIAGDLDTARQAKADAEHAVVELNLAIRNAREESQSTIAEAIAAAKQRVHAQSVDLNTQLDKQIARAETEIEAARQQAISALPVVARDVTTSLLQRLVGETVEPERVDRALSALSA